MSVLKNRLDQVTERSVLLQVLKDVEKDPNEYRFVVELFIEHLDLFGKFLTAQEFTSRIEPILVQLNPLLAMPAFAKKLSTLKTHTFRDVMTVLGWLKCLTEHRMANVIVDSISVPLDDDETGQQFHEFTVASINISEKISNFRALATSDDHLKYISTVIWVVKHQILQGLQKALQEAHSSTANVNLKTITDFVSAGRNMEVDNSNLLVKMMEWIEQLPKIDKKWKSIMKCVFMTPTDQGTQVHEALLTTLFLSVKNEKQLERCIDTSSSAINTSGTLRRVVMVKLPFQRILPPPTIKLLVDFLYKNDEEYVFSVLETALKIWSDSAYAKKCPEAQEKHMVRMIVYCIHRLKKNLTSFWTELFLSASQGVYTRMEMMPTYIRSALFLNSTLAKLADSAVKSTSSSNSPEGSQDTRPPENDDYQVDEAANEWHLEMKAILKRGIVTSSELEAELQIKVEETKDSDAAHIVKSAFVNPEKPAPAGPEFWKKKKPATTSSTKPTNPPLDSDDEEDFPEYSVDQTERDFEALKIGEEPRSSVQPPAYIIDAFEMLLEKEKMEVFEAAFFRIPHLIERKSVGFTDIAEKIVIRCLHLQNVFGTRDFDANVEEIIIGCIKNRPEIVPSLIRLFIVPGQGDRLQQRLIHLVYKSAEEMGNCHRRHESFIEEQQQRMEQTYIHAIHPYHEPRNEGEGEEEDVDDEEAADDYPSWREIVDARIAAKTRIISTRPRHKPQNGHVNRLGQVPQFMFYPLLVLPKGDNARLLNKDSDLLSLIITVASMVFLRSGISPSIVGMAQELISYVTPHRFSENQKVRTACLAAHLNVVALLPLELIVQIFPLETRRTWQDYAEIAITSGFTNRPEYEMGQQLMALLYGHFQEMSGAE